MRAAASATSTPRVGMSSSQATSMTILSGNCLRGVAPNGMRLTLHHWFPCQCDAQTRLILFLEMEHQLSLGLDNETSDSLAVHRHMANASFMMCNSILKAISQRL